MTCGKVSFFLILLVAQVFCQYDDEDYALDHDNGLTLNNEILQNPHQLFANAIKEKAQKDKITCENLSSYCSKQIEASAALTHPDLSDKSVLKPAKDGCEGWYRPIVCTGSTTVAA